jgi:hypothetical protein
MALIKCYECGKEISSLSNNCVGCGAPTKDIYAIGQPIRIENLEVAQFDYPDMLLPNNAIKICRDIGEGWHLPTIEELNILYINKGKIGGFNNGHYWSSSIGRDLPIFKSFNIGGEIGAGREYTAYHVRAVRVY